MILALLPLVAAATQPPPVVADNPDLRCMVAVSYALGAASEKNADAETLASMTSVFMYFLGKVDARQPGEDLARAFRRIVGQRGYDQQLPADLRRCGGEAEVRGAMLKDLGEQLRGIAPLAPSSAG